MKSNCQYCGGQNVTMYSGKMCYSCARLRNNQTRKQYNKEKRYHETANKWKRNRYAKDPLYRKKLRAQIMALKAYPEPQQCEVEGCIEIGQRHHDDYDQPTKIRWLCLKHHKDEHGGKFTK